MADETNKPQQPDEAPQEREDVQKDAPKADDEAHHKADHKADDKVDDKARDTARPDEEATAAEDDTPSPRADAGSRSADGPDGPGGTASGADRGEAALEPASESRPPTETSAAWARLRRALGWRVTRAQVLAGALLGLLGFAATVQVAALREDDSFASTSRTQLVQHLDTLQQHSRRLEAEISELEATRDEIASGADSSHTAARQARERETALGILSGTMRAEGPGIRLTIRDTDQPVTATLLINAVEELRDAGAEAIEVNDRVRIVAGSYVLNAETGLMISGTRLQPPYVIDAIGDPKALASAMGIPGGVSDEVSNLGGTAEIEQRKNIRVDSLFRKPPTKYAEPVPPSSDGGN